MPTEIVAPGRCARWHSFGCMLASTQPRRPRALLAWRPEIRPYKFASRCYRGRRAACIPGAQDRNLDDSELSRPLVVTRTY
jgi:hypothetical protein